MGGKKQQKEQSYGQNNPIKTGKRPKFYGRVAPTVGKYNLSKINNSMEYLLQLVDAGTL